LEKPISADLRRDGVCNSVAPAVRSAPFSDLSELEGRIISQKKNRREELTADAFPAVYFVPMKASKPDMNFFSCSSTGPSTSDADSLKTFEG
jgi:hypothetical protein